MKHLGRAGIECFAKFLNVSAITDLAPASWRSTKVVPLFKGRGDPKDMNNYRSIAITPPFTKALMAVVNRRLTDFAEEK